MDAAGDHAADPDYDSAHAVEGGAAAAVFHRFFGTDRIAFTTCSLTLPAGNTRDDAAPVSSSYSTFTEAAEENGVSRILIGFHLRKAVREGIEHGRRIGRLASVVPRLAWPSCRWMMFSGTPSRASSIACA